MDRPVPRGARRAPTWCCFPGCARATPAILRERFGVPVEKGPKDLREIPRYFGQAAGRRRLRRLRHRDPRRDQQRPEAAARGDPRRRRLLPGERRRRHRHRLHAGRALPRAGRRGPRAPRGAACGSAWTASSRPRSAPRSRPGAELVLSVNGSNLEVARELAGTRRARGGDSRLRRGPRHAGPPRIEALERWGVGYLIDPVIEPIGFGFMASLERYAEVHRRYPDAAQLMGIGNITELTSADTTGVHALLLAICAGDRRARRAHHRGDPVGPRRGAGDRHRPPADAPRGARTGPCPRTWTTGCVTVKDPAILEYDEAELRRLHAAVKDPNFRIFTDRTTITVFNNELFVRGTDIQEIFAQLGVDEATHAFYLGRELAKARLAITLGKTYRQEGALGVGLSHAAGRRAIGARQADPAPPPARRPARRARPDEPTAGAAGRQPGRRGRPDRGRRPASSTSPTCCFSTAPPAPRSPARATSSAAIPS